MGTIPKKTSGFYVLHGGGSRCFICRMTPSVQSRLEKSFQSHFPVDKISSIFVIRDKTLTKFGKRNQRYRGEGIPQSKVEAELRIVNGSEP